MDPKTKTPGGLEKKDAPVPVTSSMRPWLELDQDLVGALDQNGCFHNPLAVNALLESRGIVDEESQYVCRQLLRALGFGRSEALFEDDE